MLPVEGAWGVSRDQVFFLKVGHIGDRERQRESERDRDRETRGQGDKETERTREGERECTINRIEVDWRRGWGGARERERGERERGEEEA